MSYLILLLHTAIAIYVLLLLSSFVAAAVLSSFTKRDACGVLDPIPLVAVLSTATIRINFTSVVT